MRTIKALLAGILIGILFAPDKGTATRKKIFETIKDCKNKAKDSIDKTVNKVKSTAQKVKNDVKGAAN